jgi:hypothetical protein
VRGRVLEGKYDIRAGSGTELSCVIAPSAQTGMVWRGVRIATITVLTGGGSTTLAHVSQGEEASAAAERV